MWLHVKQNTEIILKLFRSFILHVVTVGGYAWNNTEIISAVVKLCHLAYTNKASVLET